METTTTMNQGIPQLPQAAYQAGNQQQEHFCNRCVSMGSALCMSSVGLFVMIQKDNETQRKLDEALAQMDLGRRTVERVVNNSINIINSKIDRQQRIQRNLRIITAGMVGFGSYLFRAKLMSAIAAGALPMAVAVVLACIGGFLIYAVVNQLWQLFAGMLEAFKACSLKVQMAMLLVLLAVLAVEVVYFVPVIYNSIRNSM